MAKLRLTLVTGRSISQGSGKELGKSSERYQQSVSTCELDPADMDRLGVKPGECVRLTSREGSVVVRAARGRLGAHPGIVFLPYGPYSSLLMGAETGGTGMPQLKGIEVEVEPAPGERVLGVDELLKAAYGGWLREP